ncbi:hypothetical protein AAA605_12430 [Pseudomonas aeruginosa]
MNKANECTCPSGDGSLVHPCPAHPAVEQAGGDERAACNLWIAEQQLCQGSDISLFKLERNGALVSLHDLLRDAYQAGQARAALAQPSPAPELERPEVVGYRSNETGMVYEQDYGLENPEALTTVAECDRIVGALRADRDSWAEQAEQRLADWDEMRKERDAALARVAELELGIARIAGDFLPDNSGQAELALDEMRQALHELLAAAPTQAQHSVPDGAADLCRFLAKLYCELDGLRYSTAKLPAEQIADALIFKWPVLQGARNQLNIKRISEQPYDESKLHSAIVAMLAAAPGNSAQHSVPEGWKLVPIEPLLNMMSDKDHDTRITAERQLLSILADAPGNLVPQAWLDVQAERRRQVEAEGWTPEHDDEHADGQMAQAAGCYALHAGGIGTDWPDGLQNGAALFWPWDRDSWKPTTPRRDLVKACALALAEIERLDRAGISQSPQPGATTASS